MIKSDRGAGPDPLVATACVLGKAIARALSVGHVLEGSVIWDPVEASSEATSERIEAGEARRYLRSNPAQGSRIPLKTSCCMALSGVFWLSS